MRIGPDEFRDASIDGDRMLFVVSGIPVVREHRGARDQKRRDQREGRYQPRHHGIPSQIGFTGRNPLLRERVGPQLEMRGERLGAFAALDEPRRAVAVGRPQSASLPAGLRIVDTAVEAFGVEAQADRARAARPCGHWRKRSGHRSDCRWTSARLRRARRCCAGPPTSSSSIPRCCLRCPRIPGPDICRTTSPRDSDRRSPSGR